MLILKIIFEKLKNLFWCIFKWKTLLNISATTISNRSIVTSGDHDSCLLSIIGRGFHGGGRGRGWIDMDCVDDWRDWRGLFFLGFLRRRWMGFLHSFETRSDGRPGLIIGSRVRWVDPDWPGSTKKKIQCASIIMN